MKCATGGGCGDAASMKRLHDTYICSEYHYVSNDAEPHADVCANIKAAGMVPIYDIEMAIWATTGFDVNLDIGYLRPKLQAIKDAGWRGFSSEGISQKQVSVLREYLPFINYGGERGEDVYAGNMYYRPRDMADGNYMEAYYKESAGAYHNALISANSSTPDNMGLTLMLYTNASLETDSIAMLDFVKTAINNGVRINKILFWCGVVHCPTTKLDNEFNFLWNAFNGRYGFTLDSGEPVKDTHFKFWVETQHPLVDQDVVIAAQLLDATDKPIPGKTVKVWHTSYNITYPDGSKTTDANGEIWLTQKWGYHAIREYFIAFEGDTTSNASKSGPMQVYVHQPQ